LLLRNNFHFTPTKPFIYNANEDEGGGHGLGGYRQANVTALSLDPAADSADESHDQMGWFG